MTDYSAPALLATRENMDKNTDISESLDSEVYRVFQ